MYLLNKISDLAALSQFSDFTLSIDIYVLAFEVFDEFVQLNTDICQTGAKYLCKKIQNRHHYLVVI